MRWRVWKRATNVNLSQDFCPWMPEFQLRNKMSFFSGFPHSKCVFFLESVNRSLYNDCFWAISWFINGILFSFLIFLHARCKSGKFCCTSEWRVRYLKGQTWLTLKAATSIFDHGVKTRISVEQREKALVFKKNRSSSPLEIARKCQPSKVNCE